MVRLDRLDDRSMLIAVDFGPARHLRERVSDAERCDSASGLDEPGQLRRIADLVQKVVEAVVELEGLLSVAVREGVDLQINLTKPGYIDQPGALGRTSRDLTLGDGQTR